MQTYHELLRIPYASHYKMIYLMIIIILIFVVCNISTYDSVNLQAIYCDKMLYVDVPSANSDNINKGALMKVDNVIIKYKIKSISELLENDGINYQIYEIESKNISGINNELKNITFYYNKQKIGKKFITLLFGKER